HDDELQDRHGERRQRRQQRRGAQRLAGQFLCHVRRRDGYGLPDRAAGGQRRRAHRRGIAHCGAVYRSLKRGSTGSRRASCKDPPGGEEPAPVTIATFTPGSYRFIPAVFQYSAGVVAEPGFQIERVAFREPQPLAVGFERVEALIAARQRPITAFCACELRSPLPFTDDGFRAFNEHYVRTLARWGIYDGTTNPVAR